MASQIIVQSPNATFGAYISRPAKLPAPAVVVLRELFGVNADIRTTCDELSGSSSRSRRTCSGDKNLASILT